MENYQIKLLKAVKWSFIFICKYLGFLHFLYYKKVRITWIFSLLRPKLYFDKNASRPIRNAKIFKFFEKFPRRSR